MKEKQIQQFNQMRATLHEIAKNYMTPRQLQKSAAQQGLTYEESLEMAYENIQSDAAIALRGVTAIKVQP